MLRLERLDPTGVDRADLIRFLTGNTFPFHVTSVWSTEAAEKSIDDGAFRNSDNDTFWLVDDTHGRVGLIRLEDLEEPSPLFDLRLSEEFRGRGLSTDVLKVVTDHVFRTMPEVTRFEGQTREDNIAMRTIFLRNGWLKEAHYRESWPVEGREPVASVAYAILRRDWENGTVTTFEWEDLDIKAALGDRHELRLRQPGPEDERQAQSAQKELAQEDFNFLLSDSHQNWKEYLDRVDKDRLGIDLPEGRVPASMLFAEVNGQIVGRIHIRHQLNAALGECGGHLGYAVLPAFRRRGYATEILCQGLKIAAGLGIRRALVTCDDDNQASIRTIENCGGVLEDKIRVDGTVPTRRYWIDLSGGDVS